MIDKTWRWTAVATGLLCAAATSVAAQSPAFVTVRVDTSSLVGHPAGPFALDVQLTDGSGSNDANNSVTVANIAFGAGGGVLGMATRVGGVASTAASGVTITDSAFLNSFTQPFVPGAALSFLILRTANLDAGGTPDQFSVAILDRTGAEIPTLSGSEALIVIDFNAPDPAVQTFEGDPMLAPRGGGSPIALPAAEVEVARAIAIDIKPGDDPNSINPESNGNLPVAIISSGGFDAVATIDPASLTFGRTGDEASLLRPPAREDVNGDGWIDLLCHFDTPAAAFSPGDTVGILKAESVDGAALQGLDTVRLVPSRR